MEKNNKFKLKWKRKSKLFEKYVEKDAVIATFEGLVIGFSNDNEISRKLVEILPEVNEIYIDWDYTTDVNEIYYITEEKTAGIPIIHHHKIVWAIWNGYCMDGKEIK